MSGELLTIADLAALLKMPVDLAKRKAARDNWPSVKFSSKTIRYRSEHVEAIVAKYERISTDDAITSLIGGQTERSKRRSA